MGESAWYTWCWLNLVESPACSLTACRRCAENLVGYVDAGCAVIYQDMLFYVQEESSVVGGKAAFVIPHDHSQQIGVRRAEQA